MIQLVRPELSAYANQKLIEYQTAVDDQPDFPAKVTFAKIDFPLKNVIGNTTFDEVKSSLVLMSSGAERCHYCEDSKADEIEHLLPKDVYPGHCYNWNNYYYTCGNCNGPKRNKCAVLDTKTIALIDTTPQPRRKNQREVSPIPPFDGVNAFIDLVKENPLDYFFLDISQGSFKFSESPEENTVDYLKAKYTLETLRLNTRPFLSKARSNAYNNFKARLRVYIVDKNLKDLLPEQLNEIINGIREEAHQTVCQEMKRQRNFIPELKILFDQAPEALDW